MKQKAILKYINQRLYLLSCIFFVFLFLTNCTCSGGKNRTDFELFHDMIKQENIKAQEGDEEGTFMRVPPENTRARNKEYYPYKDQPELAGKELQNPFFNQFSAELIGIGKRQYQRACIYCHGATGGGEGKVAQKMTVKPASLLSEKAINYSDGRIYHIIHEGQGLMGAYRKQVRGEKQRWALVNYVRMLQKRSFSLKEAEPEKEAVSEEKKPDSEQETSSEEKKPDSEQETVSDEEKPDSEQETVSEEKKPDSEQETSSEEKKPDSEQDDTSSEEKKPVPKQDDSASKKKSDSEKESPDNNKDSSSKGENSQ